MLLYPILSLALQDPFSIIKKYAEDPHLRTNSGYKEIVSADAQ